MLKKLFYAIVTGAIVGCLAAIFIPEPTTTHIFIFMLMSITAGTFLTLGIK